MLHGKEHITGESGDWGKLFTPPHIPVEYSKDILDCE